MNMSLMESDCFGSGLEALFLWLLAADIGAMNMAFGRDSPSRLWWSVPYSFAVAAFVLFPYTIDVVFETLNPYRPLVLSEFLMVPALWPAFAVFAECLIAPLVGVALRLAETSTRPTKHVERV